MGSTHPLPGVNGITEAYLRSAEKVSHRIKGETPRTPRDNRGAYSGHVEVLDALRADDQGCPGTPGIPSASARGDLRPRRAVDRAAIASMRAVAARYPLQPGSAAVPVLEKPSRAGRSASV